MLSNALRSILKQSTLSSESKFFQLKADNERRKMRQNKVLTIILIIASLCLIGIILVVNHIKIKRKNTEIESKIAETIDLYHQIDLTQNKLSTVTESLSIEIESLFKEQWSTLNQICNRYFDSPNDSTTKAIVLNEFEKQLKKIASPKSFLAIECAVNKYMSGIMTKLREECPYLKEVDMTFLALNFAGFSPRTICLFTNINKKNFYAKRSRIIERIKLNQPLSLELFLDKLR